MAKIIIGFNAAIDSPVNSLIEAAADQWEALNKQCDGFARTDMHTWLGEQDFMANQSDSIRPPTLSLEINASPGTRMASILPVISTFTEAIRGHIDVAQSTGLYGVEHIVVPGEPVDFCYRYFMRRRDDMCYAEYIDYYMNIHAKFGLMMPGINGYRQLHVDREASQQLNDSIRLSYIPFDSVTELYLASMDGFMEAIVGWDDRDKPGEDEEKFVRRSSSQMFTSARYSTT